MVSRRKGSPYYQYSFSMPGMPRQRGSTKEKTLARAREYESRLIHQFSIGAGQSRRPILLRDFAPTFLRSVTESRLELKSKQYYFDGWRLLSPQPIAGVRMNAITTIAAESVTAVGSGSNVNCALRTLRRMLSMAAERQIIPSVPRIHLAKERQRERMITPQEEMLLLAKASRKQRDVLILIMDTGMRPSEAAALSWDDVDFVAGVILIVRGKTPNARRHLAMTERVRTMLAGRALKGGRWVFPFKFDAERHSSGASISRSFSTLKKRLGLPTDLVLYSARHTFATDFLGATGNVAKLKAVMGHSSLTVTQRYLHPDTAELGSVMDSRNASRDQEVWTQNRTQ